MSDRFLKEKNKYHFIFITSETDYFKEYEEKYYKEKMGDKERKKMMYGLQTRVSKVINDKLVQQILKKEKSSRMQIKIKEFDNLKKLVKIFLHKNYPYVSFAYGGFKDIHEQSIKYNIPLLNHDDNCYLCKKSRKRHQKVGFFSKLFKSDLKKDGIHSNSTSLKNLHPQYQSNNQHVNLRLSTPHEEKQKRKNSAFSLGEEDFAISKLHSIKLESNIKNDIIGGDVVENINKIERDSSNLFSIVKY